MYRNLTLTIIAILVFSCTSTKKTGSNKKEEVARKKYSSILKVPEKSIQNLSLYLFIDEWYGTKYKYGGMSKNGIDCSGFSKTLYSEVYKKDIERTTKELSKKIVRKKKGKLTEGDLVFFNIGGKKDAHVGVYLLNARFVHASSSKGVIISSLENPYYKKSYNKGGTYK